MEYICTKINEKYALIIYVFLLDTDAEKNLHEAVVGLAGQKLEQKCDLNNKDEFGA